jgi:hypothetical protein
VRSQFDYHLFTSISFFQSLCCLRERCSDDTRMRHADWLCQVAADAVPPSITCPLEQNLDATGSVGTVATYEAEATDDVEVASFSCDPPSGSTFAPSTTQAVICTAFDISGNSHSCTSSVTVGTMIWQPAYMLVALLNPNLQR